MKSKLNIVGKFKIWVIITLCVLVAGLIVFGVVGFNQSVDYKNSYEVDIKIYTLDNSEVYAKNSADKYFANNGLKSSTFTMTSDEDSYSILRYKFKSNITEKVNIDDLKGEIKTELASKNISLEVEDVTINQVKNTFFGKAGYVSLALGISVVAIFVYLFFIEKLASALSVVISGIISALLFISLLAISSIPVGSFVWTMEIVSVLICVALSAGLTSRFREESKNSANAKLSNKEIANLAVDASILRYIVIAAFLVISSVLLIAVGKGDFRLIGYQLLGATIVSIFSSIVWTPIMWSLLKKDKKSYQGQAKTTEE